MGLFKIMCWALIFLTRLKPFGRNISPRMKITNEPGAA